MTQKNTFSVFFLKIGSKDRSRSFIDGPTIVSLVIEGIGGAGVVEVNTVSDGDRFAIGSVRWVS